MILAPSSPVIGLCHKVIRSQNHPTAALTTAGSLESSSKPCLTPMLKVREPYRKEENHLRNVQEWSTSELARATSWFGHNILRLKNSHNTYQTDFKVRILSFLISCQATPSISPLSCLPNVPPQLQVGSFGGYSRHCWSEQPGWNFNLFHSHTTEQVLDHKS